MPRALKNRLQLILGELQEILTATQAQQVDDLVKALLRAEKIFLYGQGRSGLVSRAFAVRLMHLGMDAHFIGDTTTPRISRRDLCLVVSGTGRTRFVRHVASVAREAKAKLATITAHPEAPIAEISDIVVTVSAPVKGETTGHKISRQPLGSLFEQASLILMDAIVLILMERRHITARALARRHANIE